MTPGEAGEPARECPECGEDMEREAMSGDYRTAKGVQGVDISFHMCPDCGFMEDTA